MAENIGGNVLIYLWGRESYSNIATVKVLYKKYVEGSCEFLFYFFNFFMILEGVFQLSER